MEAKTRILKAGAQIVIQKGFNDAGLQEILEAAEIPKGSFYYYFKSKEDFGLHLIDYFADYLKARADEFYGDQSRPHLERVRRLFAWQAESFQRNEFKGGCPIGNLALEMADRNSRFRLKLDQVFEDMKIRLAAQLRQALESGEISRTLDVEEAAVFVLSSWEGALMQMKVAKSVAPHQVFDRMIFGRLLARGEAGPA
ncbi:MAG: TetR family transcriptional regulator C-terminal domain-containing protein [Pseudomonadota bacterium]